MPKKLKKTPEMENLERRKKTFRKVQNASKEIYDDHLTYVSNLDDVNEYDLENYKTETLNEEEFKKYDSLVFRKEFLESQIEKQEKYLEAYEDLEKSHNVYTSEQNKIIDNEIYNQNMDNLALQSKNAGIEDFKIDYLPVDTTKIESYINAKEDYLVNLKKVSSLGKEIKDADKEYEKNVKAYVDKKASERQNAKTIENEKVDKVEEPKQEKATKEKTKKTVKEKAPKKDSNKKEEVNKNESLNKEDSKKLEEKDKNIESKVNEEKVQETLVKEENKKESKVEEIKPYVPIAGSLEEKQEKAQRFVDLSYTDASLNQFQLEELDSMLKKELSESEFKLLNEYCKVKRSDNQEYFFDKEMQDKEYSLRYVNTGLNEGNVLFARSVDPKDKLLDRSKDMFHAICSNFTVRYSMKSDLHSNPEILSQASQLTQKIAQSFHSLKAPGFFSKLFNTKYNQAYNTQKEALEEGITFLTDKSLGNMDPEFVEKITGKDTCKEPIKDEDLYKAYNTPLSGTIQDKVIKMQKTLDQNEIIYKAKMLNDKLRNRDIIAETKAYVEEYKENQRKSKEIDENLAEMETNSNSSPKGGSQIKKDDGTVAETNLDGETITKEKFIVSECGFIPQGGDFTKLSTETAKVATMENRK